PHSGFVTNKTSLVIKGTGDSGATITVSEGATTLGTTTVNSSGKFSLPLTKLPAGANQLLVTQIQGGVSSPAVLIEITIDLTPVILLQPLDQAGFLKGAVTFSSFTEGAAPLRYIWKKNGSVTVAASSNLTLASLTSNSVAEYQLIVAN